MELELRVPFIFPGRHVGEVLVVAFRLALLRLVLLSEMATTALVAVQRITAHQFAQLDEVGNAMRLLQLRVKLAVSSRHTYITPELLLQLRDLSNCPLKSLRVTRHAAF